MGTTPWKKIVKKALGLPEGHAGKTEDFINMLVGATEDDKEKYRKAWGKQALRLPKIVEEWLEDRELTI